MALPQRDPGVPAGGLTLASGWIAVGDRPINPPMTATPQDRQAPPVPDNPQVIFTQVLCELLPALREAMQFENGRILNGSFGKYEVPRFADVPELDIHLLNRPDLPSVGGGETPIIAIAPAIANAVFHATGVRVREMPIRLPQTGRP